MKIENGQSSRFSYSGSLSNASSRSGFDFQFSIFHFQFPFVLTLWLLQLLAVVLVWDQPLFWDNVLLTGKIPTQLWESRLSTLFVEGKLAGYPPLWGAYIAQGWLWFGRSLAVTHMLMLPILWGISYQLVRIAQLFVPRRALGLTLAVLMSVPVLAALSVQCGPDLAMVWLYLTALSAILRRNRGWLAFVLVPLALISPRGIWCIMPLFIIDQLLLGTQLFQIRWQWALGKAAAFLPAALAVAAWLAAQKAHYGWLFNDPKGDFSTLAEFTTPAEYLRQLGICAWRMVDFGQIAIFLPLSLFLFQTRRHPQYGVWHPPSGISSPASTLRPTLALLTLAPALSFALFFASFHNPIGHRYMLLPVLTAALWLCYEWAEGLRYDRFRLWALAVLVIFWTGHLWVAAYPDDWAKGWDATLVHLQAGAAKRAMAESLIALPAPERANIGARFPDESPWQDAFLGEFELTPQPYEEAVNPYLLYSSASNEFTPADLAYLNRYARPAVTCTFWPCRLQLWRNVRVPASTPSH